MEVTEDVVRAVDETTMHAGRIIDVLKHCREKMSLRKFAEMIVIFGFPQGYDDRLRVISIINAARNTGPYIDIDYVDRIVKLKLNDTEATVTTDDDNLTFNGDKMDSWDDLAHAMLLWQESVPKKDRDSM